MPEPPDQHVSWLCVLCCAAVCIRACGVSFYWIGEIARSSQSQFTARRRAALATFTSKADHSSSASCVYGGLRPLTTHATFFLSGRQNQSLQVRAALLVRPFESLATQSPLPLVFFIRSSVRVTSIEDHTNQCNASRG